MSVTLFDKSKVSSVARRSELETSRETFGDPKAAELEISRLARALWANAGYVLACAVLCAAAGYGIGRLQTPAYRSSATVELLGVNNDFLNLREVQPNSSSSVTGVDGSYMRTEIELFSSKSLVERTLAKLGELSSSAAESPEGAQTREAAQTVNGLVDGYVKRLRVEQVKESDLLQITFEDKNPEFAAKFVNTLIAEGTGRNIEDRWKSNERLGVLFSKQVEVLRHRME